ncbi:MAG: prepilin peptidase [Candidatus Glassbacteria bacterium]
MVGHHTDVAVLFGILGAMLGSFLNVCIYRLPQNRSIVFPASACPACGHPIRWYDNVPVLSWLWLRGHCRDCRARISLRYPLVELAGAALAVVLYLSYGISFDLLERFTLLFILLGISVTDAREYIIPDFFSLGGVALGLAFSFLPGGLIPFEAFLGAFIGGGSLYLVALLGELIFRKEAMGGGDVKMLAMVGSFLGWPGVLFTVFAGSAAGSLVFGTINYVFRRKALVPFGVFLSLGAAAYVFFGPQVIGWYLSFFTAGR